MMAPDAAADAAAARRATEPTRRADRPRGAGRGAHAQSEALWQRARRVIPGGVNSPVRAFGGVGGTPVFIRAAHGPCVVSVDGVRYLDFIGSWGPMIAGHAHPAVLEAVTRAAAMGTSFGATTEREVELAELVTRSVPAVQKVRFCSSGTEATMSAVRLARGATGRPKLVKFAGCYHGHADAFLSGAGSGLATLEIPMSAGVPPAAVADVITLPYNDAERASQVMAELGDQVAAILVEPVPCNMGLVPPVAGFVPHLRALCDRHGALLVFDEVITGFRLGPAGAQGALGVTPDLTCFGKIIGGGLPVGAYGGRADVMAHVSPEGAVYQAGTLSGNPLAMAAGLATLDLVDQPGFHAALEKKGARLEAGMRQVLAAYPEQLWFERMGSIFYLWFGDARGGRPRDFDAVAAGDSRRYGRFFHAMLSRGMMLAPSAFEVGFLGAAHGEADVDRLVEAADAGLADAFAPDRPVA